MTSNGCTALDLSIRKGHTSVVKRLVWAGATSERLPSPLADVTRFAVAVFFDHAALVEFNLCCFGARLTPGHPLQAFGSSTFNRDSRRIESFLVPCARAENYFRPLAAARKMLHMLLRQ